MSGQDLFNELVAAEDSRGVLSALSDEALAAVCEHIFREGEADGDHGDICGAVIMESAVRFLSLVGA